ncbi:unnamed protein product [Brassica rapa]|uniref:Replication protein A OB domain-containing protein n=1 Tax=Brassica campestris TaxID=3711 RepID=A0A8D9HIE0_BRACM|nr:unnamed protein product [Brassica rapa]CAG7883585.1 unnamed protein product [Brassica rapa]CAG7898294.1 unnamed protein product [Brassica rapa]
MLSYEQLSFVLTSRKHSTNTFIHISAPTLPPIDQLSKDVVGRICLIQGSDLYNKNTYSKIFVGLHLHSRSKMVRLTIWDNETANFRELNHISTRKNQIVIITNIIPRLHEGKLSLTTTPGSRFYFDTDIDIIQRFQKRNKLLY